MAGGEGVAERFLLCLCLCFDLKLEVYAGFDTTGVERDSFSVTTTSTLGATLAEGGCSPGFTHNVVVTSTVSTTCSYTVSTTRTRFSNGWESTKVAHEARTEMLDSFMMVTIGENISMKCRIRIWEMKGFQ